MVYLCLNLYTIMSAKKKKERKFINTPEYPGGSQAMREFIGSNLKYPDEALEKQIEGVVYLSYLVDNDAKIEDIKIIKGLGFGCDEEAIRVISLLKYGAPKNRGMRVRSTMKTKIHFRLPQAPAPVLNYTLTQDKDKQKPAVKTAGGNVYGYTLTFDNQADS